MTLTQNMKLGRALWSAAVLATSLGLLAGAALTHVRHAAAEEKPAAAYEKRWEDHTFPAAKSTCYTCHETQSTRVGRPARQHVTGAHFRAGVACIDCHGGDPTKPKLEDAHNESMGWVKKAAFDKAKMNERCGKCHTAEVKSVMDSKHQHDYEDIRQLDCTTCHGVHDIGARDVSFSWQATCLQCHSLDTIPQLPKEILEMMGTKDEMQARLRKLRYQLENKAYPAEIMEHYREVRQKSADVVHNTRSKGSGPVMAEIKEKDAKLTEEINAALK